MSIALQNLISNPDILGSIGPYLMTEHAKKSSVKYNQYFSDISAADGRAFPDEFKTLESLYKINGARQCLSNYLDNN